MVFEKVRSIIAEQLELDAESITMDSNLAEDLHADSVEVVGIVMAMEEEFSLEFPYEELEQIKTVGDAVRYIEAKQK